MQKLSNKEVLEALDKLSGWDLVDGKLHKEFKFKDFEQAFEFMKGVAGVAAKLNHHPDWSNSYNQVTIGLVTHSAGGITVYDFKLAKTADRIATKMH